MKNISSYDLYPTSNNNNLYLILHSHYYQNRLECSAYAACNLLIHEIDLKNKEMDSNLITLHDSKLVYTCDGTAVSYSLCHTSLQPQMQSE